MTVVAGVILQDGKVLVGQRRADDRHPFKWEFPGGKVERGESLTAALARELSEELGIRAAIGRELERHNFAYSGGRQIELIFFLVTDYSGEIENRIYAQTVWTAPEQLDQYPFLEGDLEFVRRVPALLNAGGA